VEKGSCGKWIRGDATGCLNKCGMYYGLHGSPGSVTCSEKDDKGVEWCDAREKPNAKQCWSTTHCGTWIVHPPAGCQMDKCGMHHGGHGKPGAVICSRQEFSVDGMEMCEMADMPEAPQCGATPVCGEWKRTDATECQDTCGMSEGHGSSGEVLCESPDLVVDGKKLSFDGMEWCDSSLKPSAKKCPATDPCFKRDCCTKEVWSSDKWAWCKQVAAKVEACKDCNIDPCTGEAPLV